MEIEIQLVQEPIAEKIPAPPYLGAHGAWLEFRGVVRGNENGKAISALEYDAYPEMAEREIHRLLTEISVKHPCLATKVIHRTGTISAGETAIYVGVASAHRGEAIALLTEFMDQLKQDVPIWKRRGIGAAGDEVTSPRPKSQKTETPHVVSCKTLDEAQAEIHSRCHSLPAVHAPLTECLGRVLREVVVAPDDSPDHDRSTRDGYAILQDDRSESFIVVDVLHAADWKPRRLKPGEAVRVATGATLPCDNLRVAMQENVERDGDRIRIVKAEHDLNVRRRGEEMKAGRPLLGAGVGLDPGKLALLAGIGCARPLVSARLRVCHFTTGDEIVPPDQKPEPGQVRDSNSILVRALLERSGCDVIHHHLPEDFEAAKRLVSSFNPQLAALNLVLVSGGASVGDKDFTRALLEWFGFETVFSQVNIRPGRPLIFGVNGNRVAFGLPGNPLSHFVGLHLFVATALARLQGAELKGFVKGRLASKLSDSMNPRETLWPARQDAAGLHPLPWASSGDLTSLAEADALIRVQPIRGFIGPGEEVEFWPV